MELKRVHYRLISLFCLIIMFMAMFLVKDENDSLSLSIPFSLLAGITIDSWWKRKEDYE